MTEAPERIWVDDERPIGGQCHVYDKPTPGVVEYATEYVRADLPAAETVKPLEWEQMDAFAWVAHGLEPAEYHISTDDRGQTWDFQEFDDPEEPPDFSGSLEATKAHVQRVHERRILSCFTTQPDQVKDAARVLLAEIARPATLEDKPDWRWLSRLDVPSLRALAKQEQSK